MNTPSRHRRRLLSFGFTAFIAGLAVLAASSAEAKLSANRLAANKLGANKLGLNGASVSGAVTEVESVRLPDGRTVTR